MAYLSVLCHKEQWPGELSWKSSFMPETKNKDKNNNNNSSTFYEYITSGKRSLLAWNS